MNSTCATREEAAADRLAAFSAPSPARTDLTAIQEAADQPAAFAVRFTPPA